ncbi:MAG TPA: hypothetical protein VEA69_21175 [Tepidisphaeraceae bacterium]|nr:hypothetical protein [Tepidisphaeraceae bacterium]
MSYQPKVYREQGGDKMIVASGGEIEVKSGGTLDVQAGSTLTLAGKTVRTVEAHTADDTLTAAESGSVHTNNGAAGAITLTLPAAVTGLEFFFGVREAQELRLDPDGTETISLPSNGVPGAAGKYLTANAAGETVHLMCVEDGTWAVMGYTGTWTAEA